MNLHDTATSKLRVRGLECAMGSFAPLQRVAKHSHENAMFCMALRGACTEFYGNKVRMYEPSFLSFLPSNQTHSLAFHNTGMRSFSIEIAPGFAKGVREYSLTLDTSVHP